MIISVCGDNISNELLGGYIDSLVNCFFKILPMRENGEQSLALYMEGLRREMLGCGSLIPALNKEPMYLTLMCILQSFIDNPEMDISDVKRDVFRAISVCNKLSKKVLGGDDL